MILKKPYAFIIRHFRLIHLIALIPMLYLVTKTRGIVTFFADYVRNGYILSGNVMISNLSANYINIFMYIAIIMILIIFLILAFILQRKNKPTKFYTISILYYIALLVLLSFGIAVFQSIELDTLANTLARIIRDLLYIVYYSEYLFIIFTGIRGIGFNIKKFDFKGDIEDLKISSEDNEEFEFLVGKDSYKTKRTIRRFFRELTYYYKENKFIFLIIIIILMIIIGSSLYTKKAVYEREFRENDTIGYSYFNFKVLNSYISSLDLNGNKIKEGKKYLILQTEISNRSRDDQILSYGNIQLAINKLKISPNLNVSNSFADFGRPYDVNLIKGNSDIKYVFVYEMDDSLIVKNLKLEVYSGFDTSLGGIGAINRKINLDPQVLNDNIVTNTISKGAKVSINSAQLGSSDIQINDYSLADRFSYKLNGVTKEIYINLAKDSNQTLMILDYNLNLDKASDYMIVEKTFKSFFNDFMKIKYTYNGEEYFTKVNVLNPINYKDKLVFKVNKNIVNAESIEAIITFRNVAYNYKLK